MKKENTMKSTMIKLFVGIVALSVCIYAGGDIAPAVEPVTDPETDSGSAMGMVSMLVLMFLTTAIGSFFIKKENV